MGQFNLHVPDGAAAVTPTTLGGAVRLHTAWRAVTLHFRASICIFPGAALFLLFFCEVDQASLSGKARLVLLRCLAGAEMGWTDKLCTRILQRANPKQ